MCSLKCYLCLIVDNMMTSFTSPSIIKFAGNSKPCDKCLLYYNEVKQHCLSSNDVYVRLNNRLYFRHVIDWWNNWMINRFCVYMFLVLYNRGVNTVSFALFGTQKIWWFTQAYLRMNESPFLSVAFPAFRTGLNITLISCGHLINKEMCMSVCPSRMHGRAVQTEIWHGGNCHVP